MLISSLSAVQAAPRPDQSSFGPLNSVIEINVPGQFYSQTTTATVHSHDHRHVRDVEANRMSVDEKDQATAY